MLLLLLFELIAFVHEGVESLTVVTDRFPVELIVEIEHDPGSLCERYGEVISYGILSPQLAVVIKVESLREGACPASEQGRRVLFQGVVTLKTKVDQILISEPQNGI